MTSTRSLLLAALCCATTFGCAVALGVGCSNAGGGGGGGTPGDDTGAATTPPDDSSAGGDGSGGDASDTGTSTTPPVDTGIKPPVDTGTPPPDTAGGPCTDDMQCPAGDYCTRAGACASLGDGKCAGGSSSASCGGYAPRCKDYACFQSGACGGVSANCHAGDDCTTRSSETLCFPTSPCKETVTVADVASGKYAPGKEVCVRDYVHGVLSETDGDYHIRMGHAATQVFGTCPFPVVPPGVGLVTELTPEYQRAGLATPSVGSTITVQGTVRWDGAHCWWEIHPIKYIGP